MATVAVSAIGTRVQGQLPSSKGTLDTIAASTATGPVTVELCNTNTADEAVVLYKKISGGTSKICWQGTLIANGGNVRLVLGSMTAGDLLEGTTTTATKVDFTVSCVTFSVT